MISLLKRRWFKSLVAGTLVAGGAFTLAGLYSTSWLKALGARAEGERLRQIEASPLYKDGAFENVIPTKVGEMSTMWPVLLEWINGDEERTPLSPTPMHPDTASALAAPIHDGLRLTWLGHSTVLIELEGATMLTDPMFGERASPSTLMGPKRFHAPPLALSQLPQLDAVLISHDHYDHLDMGSIQWLAANRDMPFYAPLGVGAHLEAWGVPAERIIEVRWWDELAVGSTGVKAVATPSRHFSGRGLTDRNATLWTSWAVVGPTRRVYFSGDTGPTPQFEEIGARLGPFDVTMLEVGAQHPSWGEIHLGPVEALRAHKMLRGDALLPIHWGTFELALHAWNEPLQTLSREATTLNIPLLTPIVGAPISVTDETPVWWEDMAR